MAPFWCHFYYICNMQTKKDIMPKCCLCGKFISGNEVVVRSFTPDTPFGPEKIIFEHTKTSKKCLKQ